MKFRTKMTVCMIWLLALAYGVGGSLLIGMNFQNSLEKEKGAARQSCQMLVNTLVLVNDYNRIGSCVEQLGVSGTNWSGIMVISQGDVLYQQGEVTQISEASLQMSGKTLLLSCTIRSNLPDIEVTAAFDLTPIYEQRDGQLTIYRWTFGIVILVGSLISLVLCSWLTVPLQSVTRAAKLIGSSRTSRRIYVHSRDEVGMLAEEFNNMADRVEESLDGMKAAMERQEEFMGSFAHELKTPMTSIIGYADLLRSQSLPEEDRRAAANYIFSEGKRLENLSLKLLELLVMEREKLPMRLCSPRRIIEGLVKEYRPIYAKQGIVLACSCQAGNCRLEPDLFRSLLYNLVDNSRKALDGAGHIQIHLVLTDVGCRLEVRDDGRGMPPEVLNRLTEAFYRVDKSRSRAQGGAGLGLALCQRIVVLHRGSISFASREGEGTCVRVEITTGRGEERANV